MIVEWGREIKSSHVVYYVIYIAYNNNVLCGCVSERFAWIWAFDSSYYKNDHVMLMGENSFARAARPQPSKMCFFLYKVVLRLVLLIRIVDNLGTSEGYN